MAVLGKTVNRKNSTKIGFIIILIICIVIVRKSGFINETNIDKIAESLGEETNQFWQKIKSDAKKDLRKE